MSGYQYLPEDFMKNYRAVIDAKTIEGLRQSSITLLKSLDELYKYMIEKFVEKPVPTYDNLRGTYEELWCNYRNKVIISCDSNDKNYAFHAALGAQNFFDEMTTEHVGTPKFNLMQHFDPNNLEVFKNAFLCAMDEYLQEYEKVGRKVEKFDTFEKLYEQYMKEGTNNERQT